MKIAVLLTCFNRKDFTIRCLSHLYKLGQKVDIYLVDDNSTDGTYIEVRKQFPEVVLISGTGNLFWNRGMLLAWEHAAHKKYDYFLWLNDDVVLYDNSISEIFECCKMSNYKAIITGIIESHDKSQILYGGADLNKKLIAPNGLLNEVRYMNGNFVLIPSSVFEIVGYLDGRYHHDLGDVDYGLVAIKNNIKVLTTRIAIGSGEVNKNCRIRKPHTSLANRFKKLYSPLGSNPFINFYFRKKHFGILNALLFFVFLHVVNLMPDFVVKRVWGNKYF